MPEVIMPKMGDAMTEGKVLRWMKQPGEAVKKGEPIAEIETDKVNVDLEAEWDGTLAQVVVGAGAVAAVGAPIAFIARPGEAVTTPAAPAAPPGQAPAAASPRPAAPPAHAAPPGPTGVPTERRDGGRASPLARRLAEQHGIPLSAIVGTGPDGRITKEDVDAAIAAGSAAATAAPAAARPGAAPPAAGAREVPLTRIRQTIARRMTESKQQAPHFYITVSITMDAALALRRQLNERLPDDQKISVNDLVIKATALTLLKFPNLNASYAGEVIRHPEHINISMAVPLPEGLISPTLHDCDRKPLAQIAQESKALVERARRGRLRADDVSGGTFTISNLGPFDVESFVAIINPPQAAILAVGTAKPQPVVRDGQVTVATVMQATLSVDHRVTDGAEAATFVAALRTLLEDPGPLAADAA
jgi:pyruvate dehydrogenase E2 component (dihydrolipoamide acetyltransferase)